ncbi:WhiB family transcriptional regulator [Streptomyces turgidiscabies]|uniref:WhiB family transcriptional regulator n=1 Tax=Streptomyces turgidiscabies TaxID=85558 RepID=UPI0038F79AAE
MTVDWRSLGLCREDKEPDAWFPVGSSPQAKAAETHAKAVCWQCPARERCAWEAIERREPSGVWGGLSEGERRAILRRRGIRLLDTDTGADDDTNDQPRTLHTIWEARAAGTGDGHCAWKGGQPITFRQQHFTPHQIAFTVSRGRPPVGVVTATCTKAGCILPAHIADQQEREQQSRATAATA